MATSSKIPGLALKKPCANCPFLREGAIELMPGRVEGIVADLVAHDNTNFQCHKTTHGKQAASNCVGSIVYMLKLGRPSVSMRFAMAVGLVDPADYTRFNDIILDLPDAVADTSITPETKKEKIHD